MAKIVIIDDEKEILGMMERYLTRENKNEVKTFSNPLNALSSLDPSTQVVFLDVMMPEINGLELLPKLVEKYPKVKVIMMTAYSTLDKVLVAHRNGATNYIMKPFESLAQLDKKISEALS
ncbi:MAG: regulator [Sulfuricurvum sp. PC08-66]|nr:MAG: regulator [Sulfuricurvum sp. PC08-66]